jgi:hypothetical protein
LRVGGLLLLLELIVRVGPVKTVLSDALDPYENLLWYSDIMPAYQDQLLHGPHYDLWLAGSSYMMTGLQPEWVNNALADQGITGLTVQNYGMTDMRTLYDMADVYDHWMFQMDQPKYMVIGISVFNFSAKGDSTARSSPMERTYIFPDSIDDYVSGWLFRHSDLYRYSLLARNASFIPREEAILKPHPLGGYIGSDSVFEGCDPTDWKAPDSPQDPYPQEVFAPLDRFIDVAQTRHIPLVVVDIPLQYCNMRRFFPSRDAYETNYIQQVTTHLAAKHIPFLELATPFYAQIPQDEQYKYFIDHHHPNNEGAKLFSRWTGDFVAAWLKTLQS